MPKCAVTKTHVRVAGKRYQTIDYDKTFKHFYFSVIFPRPARNIEEDISKVRWKIETL